MVFIKREVGELDKQRVLRMAEIIVVSVLGILILLQLFQRNAVDHHESDGSLAGMGVAHHLGGIEVSHALLGAKGYHPIVQLARSVLHASVSQHGIADQVIIEIPLFLMIITHAIIVANPYSALVVLNERLHIVVAKSIGMAKHLDEAWLVTALSYKATPVPVMATHTRCLLSSMMA